MTSGIAARMKTSSDCVLAALNWTTLRTFCTFLAGALTHSFAVPQGGLINGEHATNA